MAESNDVRLLDAELRERLRGVRLVLEAGLDDETIERVQAGVQRVALYAPDPETTLAHLPALLAFYLVAEGQRSYDGSYWPYLPVPGMDQTRLGRAFLEAVRTLGLERFEVLADDNALHYVGPILAHGGIPRYCLHDLFRLLLLDLRRYGSSGAQELVAIWRARKTALETVDRPVKRFLLYGGATALDFLDRCIELARLSADELRTDSETVGLPGYVVRAYQEYLSSPGAAPSLGRQGVSLPRPAIHLDPWDRLGPVLELPPLPGDFTGTWEVNDGERTRSIRPSGSETVSVRLFPAAAWEVRLLSTSLERTFAFECLGQSPVICFDPRTRRYLDDSKALALDDLWVVVPATAELSARDPAGDPVPLDVVAKLPDLLGGWTGFSARHLRFPRAGQLHVAYHPPRGSPRDAIVRIVRPADRPALDGEPVERVASALGQPVFAAVPALRLPVVAGFEADRWYVSLRTPAGTVVGTLGDLDLRGQRVELLPLLGREPFGVVDLVVRGPLGSDLRESFVVVPGLAVEAPSDLVLPNREHGLTVTLRAARDLAIASREAGRSAVVAIPEGSDAAEVEISGRDVRVLVRVVVPKLVWGIAGHDGVARLGTARVTVERNELDAGGRAQELLVRTRLPGTLLSVALTSDAEGLLQELTSIADGPEGTAAFDLGSFRDTIMQNNEPAVALVLLVDERSVPVATLRADVGAHDIAVEIETVEGVRQLCVRFSGRLVQRRVVRLWSLQRPWQAPLVFPVDDAACEVVTSAPSLVSGDYRVQVAVDDPWFPATRPLKGTAGTIDVPLGERASITEAHRALEYGSPIQLLELAMVTGLLPRELDDADLCDLAGPALVAATEILPDASGDPAAERRLATIAAILFRDAAVGIAAVADALRTERVLASEVMRIATSQLSRLVPRRDVSEGDIRTVWQTLPALAAFIDVPLAGEGDAAAADRCEEFLGWRPGAALPHPGTGMTRLWTSMPSPQLRLIRDMVGLVPSVLLAEDAYVVANFEWLLAAHEDANVIDEWWAANAWLASDLAGDIPTAAPYLEARRPDLDPDHPWAGIPQATFAGALHVASGDAANAEAARALAEALSFAPRLVTHDLALARVLAPSWAVSDAELPELEADVADDGRTWSFEPGSED